MRRVHRRGAGGTNRKFFIYPSKSFIKSDQNLNIVVKEASNKNMFEQKNYIPQTRRLYIIPPT